MKFEQYKLLKDQAVAVCAAAGVKAADVDRLNPILLAYIGDAVFSLYVRLRLLPTSGQVRVLHDLGAKFVSAVYQSHAMEQLEPELTEEEQPVFRRGRNAKSIVPKSASVHQYRMATALEALLGWLFLQDRQERLEKLLEKSFDAIAAKMQAEKQ
ncbi:MAG: ribonuclease III domain-containing protein [Acidaminococcaceae bacterium]|nr:ribonuclease III domain-containing protein [Acidaminococcaceae bacterium]